MKRITAILLSVLMILSCATLLLACGGSDVTTTSTTSTTTGTVSSATTTTTKKMTSSKTTSTTQKPSLQTPAEDKKNVMIFGDSYSTFQGWIPAGYATWYSAAGRPETDVKKVTQTWWYALCEEMNYYLVKNDSYSGSTVGNTGYGGSDCSQTSSFLHRLEVYKNQNFFAENDVDVILVFGGTNDSWCGAALGEYKTEGITQSDCYKVLPAIVAFLGKLKEAAPNAEIVFIINTDLKPEIGETVKKASQHFGTKYVELTAFSKQSGHPTIRGMESIKNQVKQVLD